MSERRRKKWWRRLLGRALAAVGATTCGCFEIPPALPLSATFERALEPPAVYVDDPYHAASRWFRRAFCGADGERALEPCDPAVLLPPRRSFTAVDYAELLALLDAFAPSAIEHPALRDVFRADALTLACLLPLDPPESLAQDLARRLLERLTRIGFEVEAEHSPSGE